MPTYEYQCAKCGKRFDLFQSMKEPRKKTCPKCKGRVKRLIGTGVGLIFKGSGFYSTDYRSEGYKSAAKKDVPASTSSGSATESKPSDSVAKPKSSGSEAKK